MNTDVIRSTFVTLDIRDYCDADRNSVEDLEKSISPYRPEDSDAVQQMRSRAVAATGSPLWVPLTPAVDVKADHFADQGFRHCWVATAQSTGGRSTLAGVVAVRLAGVSLPGWTLLRAAR